MATARWSWGSIQVARVHSAHAQSGATALYLHEPERSGILLDDIALLPAGPAKITAVAVEPVQVPVLVGQSANPLLRVRIDVTGSLKPIGFANTQVSIGGTITDADLESIEWLSTGYSPNFTDPKTVAKAPA